MHKITTDHQTYISMAIYEHNQAFVEDQRLTVGVKAGGIVQYKDFVEGIKLSTLQVEGAVIKEQRLRLNYLSEEALLMRFIGKELHFQGQNEDAPRLVRLISYTDQNSVLLDVERKIYLFNPEGKFLIPADEDNDYAPSIQWVFTEVGEMIVVRYLTEGFSWDMQYFITITEIGFLLKALCTIQNNTKMYFKDIPLRLISGTKSSNHFDRSYMDFLRVDQEQPHIQTFEVGGHHVLELPGTINLYPRESVSVGFFHKKGQSISHVYKASSNRRVLQSTYSFLNSVENELGIILPSGKIHISHEGEFTTYLGENHLSKKINNEWISLKAGDSYDLSKNYKVVNSYEEDDCRMYEIEVEFENHVNRKVTVEYSHHFQKDVWEIVESSHVYEKRYTDAVEFDLELEPYEKTIIKFVYYEVIEIKK